MGTFSLKLIEGQGWILSTNILFDKCNHCRGEMVAPFFFCTHRSLGFCHTCEIPSNSLERGYPLCNNTKECIHINVIQLVGDKNAKNTMERI